MWIVFVSTLNQCTNYSLVLSSGYMFENDSRVVPEKFESKSHLSRCYFLSTSINFKYKVSSNANLSDVIKTKMRLTVYMGSEKSLRTLPKMHSFIYLNVMQFFSITIVFLPSSQLECKV